MKKNFLKKMALLGVALLFFACYKANDPTFDQELQAETPSISQNETFVSMTKAVDVAAVFLVNSRMTLLRKAMLPLHLQKPLGIAKTTTYP